MPKPQYPSIISTGRDWYIDVYCTDWHWYVYSCLSGRTAAWGVCLQPSHIIKYHISTQIEHRNTYWLVVSTCLNPSERYESRLGWLFPINGKMFQTTNQTYIKHWYIFLPEGFLPFPTSSSPPKSAQEPFSSSRSNELPRTPTHLRALRARPAGLPPTPRGNPRGSERHVLIGGFNLQCEAPVR